MATKRKVVRLLKNRKGRAHKDVMEMLRKNPRVNEEMVAGAVAIVLKDGTVITEYVNGVHHFPLVGAVTSLQRRLVDRD